MTTSAAHPELADLAASLGYTYRTPIGRMGDWWDARTPDARLVARLVVDDGYEVYAFTENVVLAWSARMTSDTPPAALAAVMAVAAAEATR